MKYAWATSRRAAGSFGFQGMLLDTEEASKLCIAPNWLPVSPVFYTAAKKLSHGITAQKFQTVKLLKSRTTHNLKHSFTLLTLVVLKPG